MRRTAHAARIPRCRVSHSRSATQQASLMSRVREIGEGYPIPWPSTLRVSHGL